MLSSSYDTPTPPPKKVSFNSVHSDKCAVLRNRTETCISPCSSFYFISVNKYQADFPSYVASRCINMSHIFGFVHWLYFAPIRVATPFVHLCARVLVPVSYPSSSSVTSPQIANLTLLSRSRPGYLFTLTALPRLTPKKSIIS